MPFLRADVPDSVAGRVVEKLARRRLHLALAESCTGGLLAAAITDVPGASAVLRGGVVAYTDAAKVAMLDVDETLITSRGSVSPEVTSALARGARRRFASDFALAVTGYAGPSGPAEDVGLVHVDVVTPTGEHAQTHRFEGDRDAIRHQATHAALALLLDHL